MYHTHTHVPFSSIRWSKKGNVIAPCFSSVPHPLCCVLYRFVLHFAQFLLGFPLVVSALDIWLTASTRVPIPSLLFIHTFEEQTHKSHAQTCSAKTSGLSLCNIPGRWEIVSFCQHFLCKRKRAVQLILTFWFKKAKAWRKSTGRPLLTYMCI